MTTLRGTAATGDEDAADALVLDMRAEIAALVESVEPREEPLSYYHELDDTLYTVTSSTFIGEVYTLAGLVNALSYGTSLALANNSEVVVPAVSEVSNAIPTNYLVILLEHFNTLNTLHTPEREARDVDMIQRETKHFCVCETLEFSGACAYRAPSSHR